MDADLDDQEWRTISAILESYLIRRAVCNLGTKNYNRTFLSLTRNMRKDCFTADRLKMQLLGTSGSAVIWPDDATFREAWLHGKLYEPLNSSKLVHLFGRLNETFMSSKSEKVVFATRPTVEHIMPQNWISTWPLPDGSKGLDSYGLYIATKSDPVAEGSRKREAAIQSLGNLTILSSGLNSSQKNLAWEKKRPEMMKHSLLQSWPGMSEQLRLIDKWTPAGFALSV